MEKNRSVMSGSCFLWKAVTNLMGFHLVVLKEQNSKYAILRRFSLVKPFLNPEANFSERCFGTLLVAR